MLPNSTCPRPTVAVARAGSVCRHSGHVRHIVFGGVAETTLRQSREGTATEELE
jgi:hypothetical protein